MCQHGEGVKPKMRIGGHSTTVTKTYIFSEIPFFKTAPTFLLSEKMATSTNPSFGMTTRKIFKDAFLRHTNQINFDGNHKL